LKYEVPRLFFFLKTGKLPSEKAPSTIASLNYNHQQWLQYYTLNSFNLTYGYKWTNASRFHHDIKPITFNFIDVSSTTASFQQNLDDNPLLAVSFTDQIIYGSQYRFSFNTRRKPDQKSYFYLQNIFEMAGNKSWLVSKLINPNPSGQYTLLGVPYAQFLRNEVELRFHNDITANKSFVARGEVGIGYAYGNSDILPFTKKFFAGGPNTIRGFGFRSLGPGRYNYVDGNNRINPIQQSGDIKVLFNAEYRFPLYYIFKGAFFLDAGNIWLLENDPERPSGVFRFNQFIEQMALSAGFGLRLDFDFFVIRGDVGIPIYKPYLEPQNRWITEYQTTSIKQWRKDNAILNVAIGYPF
jgi:outer membrane protein assembly factor BamA